MTPTEQDKLREQIETLVFARFYDVPKKQRKSIVANLLKLITANRKRVALEARIDSLLAAKRRIYETGAFELGLALGIIDSELKKLGWTPGELKQELREVMSKPDNTQAAHMANSGKSPSYALGDAQAELDDILAKHNGELGITWEDPDVVTPDTKQAIVEWHEIEKLEVYNSGCVDTAKHILALFDNQIPEQLKQWLRLEIEDRGKL